MSAGHSLRRQNYNFVTFTPPVIQTAPEMHVKRVVLAIVSAVALDIATFATLASLITGR
jgi:hypothetical protein